MTTIENTCNVKAEDEQQPPRRVSRRERREHLSDRDDQSEIPFVPWLLLCAVALPTIYVATYTLKGIVKVRNMIF